MTDSQHRTEADGPTTRLSSWVSSLKLEDVPAEIVTRAKYLILDGVACGLVGANLPWSAKAAKAIFDLEPAGDVTIIGWEKKLPPQSAALLNSSFIQGFELDDWHSEAPLHSNSILLPASLAAAQHTSSTSNTRVSGSDLLLAMITGYEVGPRVGLGLYGTHILSTGWHSGAVFGPSASAAAVAKIIGLNADQMEDAFGTACTQACGLMSAQFGSEVKRMQHGFAARNGLLAAFLARSGYTGIRGVFETDYGGFLKQFSLGNGKDPQYRPEEVAKDLGSVWKTKNVRLKPYAAMAGTHPTVDCVRGLQEQYGHQMQDFSKIVSIKITMGEAAYHHGGWKATRPLATTGAQMSNAYVCATQIVHRDVLPAQFRAESLSDNDVWRLVDLTTCVMDKDTSPSNLGQQEVTITFDNGSAISHSVNAARGVNPPLSNEEIVQKWRKLAGSVIDEERMMRIERLVLELKGIEDVGELQELLFGRTRNPIP